VHYLALSYESASSSRLVSTQSYRSFQSSGRDRNSYYHPLFLRGLPHLCKAMKRPGVAKKLAADPGKYAQVLLFRCTFRVDNIHLAH
jgi:hypothetical protein